MLVDFLLLPLTLPVTPPPQIPLGSSAQRVSSAVTTAAASTQLDAATESVTALMALMKEAAVSVTVMMKMMMTEW